MYLKNNPLFSKDLLKNIPSLCGYDRCEKGIRYQVSQDLIKKK